MASTIRLTDLVLTADLRCECPHGVVTLQNENNPGSLLIRFPNKETLRYSLRTLRFAGWSPLRLPGLAQKPPQHLRIEVAGEIWAEFAPDGRRRVRYGKWLPQVVYSYFNW